MKRIDIARIGLLVAAAAIAALVAGCGGGGGGSSSSGGTTPTTFTVTGTLDNSATNTALSAGTIGVTENGTAVTIGNNGAFTFTVPSASVDATGGLALVMAYQGTTFYNTELTAANVSNGTIALGTLQVNTTGAPPPPPPL